MDKEEVLLKNFSLLSKDPLKYDEGLKSAVGQLLELNPKLGMRCWEECINAHISQISVEFGKSEFSYENVGRVIIRDFEEEFCQQDYFINALGIFARNKNLLDIIYTKSPIYKYCSGNYPISFLIRHDRMQEADNILSAIYRNQTFNEYTKLWRKVIEDFKWVDKDHYSGGGVYNNDLLNNVPEDTRNFCMAWIERIKNEEEQAGAMTFAMQMY